MTSIGVIVPLLTIAGSSVAFVYKTYRDARQDRRKQFFELMDLIDNKGTIAAKTAAVYQLRFYPEHKDFIIRFCDAQGENITGPESATRILSAEMRATRHFFAA